MIIIVVVVVTNTSSSSSINMIIIIIIIALKGAVRDFYNLFTAPRTVFSTYAQEVRAQSCANHVQHIALIMCNMSCATW